MARITRMAVKREPAVYHVMTLTALGGYILGDAEKEYLFQLIKKLSSPLSSAESWNQAKRRAYFY